MKLKVSKFEGEFAELFDFGSEMEEAEHIKGLFSHIMITEIAEAAKKRNITTRKGLAKIANVTPSFISQIFNGDKFLSLDLIAKFIYNLDLEVEIKIEASKLREESIDVKTIENECYEMKFIRKPQLLPNQLYNSRQADYGIACEPKGSYYRIQTPKQSGNKLMLG
jgi:transcriptional regulator with XRE-family HTH domain